MEENISAISTEQSNTSGSEGNSWTVIPSCVMLVLMILATAIGNVLVIVAVVRESRLKSTANKLVASLAVTDLVIGILVMPMAAAYHIQGKWLLGPTMCDVFVILDVLCCTSSILHLVAIALDRYWSFTDISYSRGNQRHKYFLPIAITGTWLISAAICIPGFFGWREIQQSQMCLISQDKIYTIYSTVGAFYLPLVIIIVIYWKIFMVVRARVRGTSLHQKSTAHDERPQITNSTTCQTMETTLTTSPSCNGSADLKSSDGKEDPLLTYNSNDRVPELDEPTTEEREYIPEPVSHKSIQKLLRSVPLVGLLRNGSSNNQQRDKLATKRERRALRTLIIITGAFASCWLPFFIFAVIIPFSDPTLIPLEAIYFVTWLGYFNSMLNPVIYTIFSADFRQAFKKLLCFR